MSPARQLVATGVTPHIVIVVYALIGHPYSAFVAIMIATLVDVDNIGLTVAVSRAVALIASSVIVAVATKVAEPCFASVTGMIVIFIAMHILVTCSRAHIGGKLTNITYRILVFVDVWHFHFATVAIAVGVIIVAKCDHATATKLAMVVTVLVNTVGERCSAVVAEVLSVHTIVIANDFCVTFIALAIEIIIVAVIGHPYATVITVVIVIIVHMVFCLYALGKNLTAFITYRVLVFVRMNDAVLAIITHEISVSIHTVNNYVTYVTYAVVILINAIP